VHASVFLILLRFPNICLQEIAPKTFVPRKFNLEELLARKMFAKTLLQTPSMFYAENLRNEFNTSRINIVYIHFGLEIVMETAVYIKKN